MRLLPNGDLYIHVFDEITWITAESLFTGIIDFMHTPDVEIKRLVVVVGSPGGDPEASIAMYTTLRAANLPIISVGLGAIYSAAIYPFMAGDKRLLFPEATFLFHATLIDPAEEPQPVYQLKEDLQGDSINEKILNQIIKPVLKAPPSATERILKPRESYYVTSGKALKWGLATGIIKKLSDID